MVDGRDKLFFGLGFKNFDKEIIFHGSTNKGNWMGTPYEGMSIVGYDNARKVFVSSWIDNMGTGVMQMSDPYDSASKTIHFKGTETDPVSGKQCDVREEFKFNAYRSRLMEMYGSLVAGTPKFKMVEI